MICFKDRCAEESEFDQNFFLVKLQYLSREVVCMVLSDFSEIKPYNDFKYIYSVSEYEPSILSNEEVMVKR